jgi:1,4-dihydroxy-6-naphthoate synthase
VKLTIGFSPCPNDTFIFDALLNSSINTGGIEFDVVLEDVQTLNEWALAGKLDVTKLSYGVLPLALNEYIVLNSGSALGKGVGPLLITGSKLASVKTENIAVAIPGEHTTAHLLFSMAYPEVKNKIFLRYDAIEDFVLAEKGHGVIIHENRFTYADKGLVKITDLGDYWEQHTGKPIPLGGIVIKRSIDVQLQQHIDGLIKQSIQLAYTKYPALSNFVRQHAQEMSEAVMRQHIDLYVNEYSLQLGNDGKAAIIQLLQVFNSSYSTSAFTNTNEIFVKL